MAQVETRAARPSLHMERVFDAPRALVWRAWILYLIPRTSVLGAVLFMGLLGGAMATQIRAESPLFSHILFSLYLGLFMWSGLWLRDARLRAVFPLLR